MKQIFCEIPADLVHNFKEMLEKRTFKKLLHKKYLILLMLDLQKASKVLSLKQKLKEKETK